MAKVISEVDELREDWGVAYSQPAVDIDKVRARKDKVISTLSGGLANLAKQRKVRVIQARGIFEKARRCGSKAIMSRSRKIAC